ncbi:MAG: His-Xaa-Ser system protein HxsD [Longimicrobiaceae bacterium]
MMVHEASASHLELRLRPDLYSEAVVFKCFYWYGSEFDVTIDRADDAHRSLAVVLSARRPPLSGEDLERLISRVKRDLVDFKTRDIVARETQAIRELLVAKAFASSDELDEPLLGSITDLGGSEPRAIHHAGT